MKGVIYKITSPSGKIYIGQTKNFNSRLSHYKGLHCKKQPKLFNSFTKYGYDNHKIEVIDEVHLGIKRIIINTREEYWINEFDSFNNGLNCSIGGGTNSGNKLSDETKLKISKANKGKIRTQAFKDRMSQIRKGKKFSEQYKKNVSKRMSKKISIDGIIYESSIQAAKFLNCTPANICYRLNNKENYIRL